MRLLNTRKTFEYIVNANEFTDEQYIELIKNKCIRQPYIFIHLIKTKFNLEPKIDYLKNCTYYWFRDILSHVNLNLYDIIQDDIITDQFLLIKIIKSKKNIVIDDNIIDLLFFKNKLLVILEIMYKHVIFIDDNRFNIIKIHSVFSEHGLHIKFNLLSTFIAFVEKFKKLDDILITSNLELLNNNYESVFSIFSKNSSIDYSFSDKFINTYSKQQFLLLLLQPKLILYYKPFFKKLNRFYEYWPVIKIDNVHFGTKYNRTIINCKRSILDLLYHLNNITVIVPEQIILIIKIKLARQRCKKTILQKLKIDIQNKYFTNDLKTKLINVINSYLPKEPIKEPIYDLPILVD